MTNNNSIQSRRKTKKTKKTQKNQKKKNWHLRSKTFLSPSLIFGDNVRKKKKRISNVYQPTYSFPSHPQLITRTNPRLFLRALVSVSPTLESSLLAPPAPALPFALPLLSPLSLPLALSMLPLLPLHFLPRQYRTSPAFSSSSLSQSSHALVAFWIE